MKPLQFARPLALAALAALAGCQTLEVKQATIDHGDYIRIGGLALEPPLDFLDRVQSFIRTMPEKIDEYSNLLTGNPIFRSRLKGVGHLSAADAIALGVTGPPLRASGVDIDLLREISDLTAAGTGIEGVRRILELEDRVAALSSRNEELVAELEATREALRLTAAGRPQQSSGTRVPAVRPQQQNQSIVVWRRQR